MNPKLIRITTVPQSLRGLLKGQHRFMSENGFEVIGVSSPGQALDDVKENEGIRVEAIEMSRTISPVKDLKTLWKLYRLFKKEKPTIVHTHTPKAGTVGMLAAKLAGVPYRLHTIAGLPLLEAKGKKRQLLNFVEKVTYSCSTMIYPNSYGLHDIILENKFTKPSKLKVIGLGSSNGIDSSHFDPTLISREEKLNLRNSLNIGADDFVFLFVGRLVGDKGINELIAAFDQLNEPKAYLVLVGSMESDLDPLLPQTLQRIQDNNHIIPVGYQSDVRPYFAVSDCLAFPSYREGFPNVVMQAGAMGIPSIVSDINGCNEIINDGQNGYIIPIKDTERLYDRMKYVFSNPEKTKSMGLNSRDNICEKYERKFVWNEILKEYRLLMKS